MSKYELTPEMIEELAIKSMQNFGAPERILLTDPESGEQVWFDMKEPTDEAIELMGKLLKKD